MQLRTLFRHKEGGTLFSVEESSEEFTSGGAVNIAPCPAALVSSLLHRPKAGENFQGIKYIALSRCCLSVTGRVLFDKPGEKS